MRSRLLQRIHLAYLRQVQAAYVDASSNEIDTNSSGSSGNSSQVLRVTGGSGGQAQNESGDAILTATSIRMSLAILQCLGPASKNRIHSLIF